MNLTRKMAKTNKANGNKESLELPILEAKSYQDLLEKSVKAKSLQIWTDGVSTFDYPVVSPNQHSLFYADPEQNEEILLLRKTLDASLISFFASSRGLWENVESLRFKNWQELIQGLREHGVKIELRFILPDKAIRWDGRPLRKKRQKSFETTKIPDKLPQQTFQEARNAMIAIADGYTGRRWTEITGEVALGHAIENEPIQTLFSFGPALAVWGLPLSYESLRDELERLGPEAVLLYQICLGTILQNRLAVLDLDDLIKVLGKTPRSTAEREEMRQEVFRLLCIFDNISLHGKRVGKYKDPMTGETIDLSVNSKLLTLSETYYKPAGQGSLYSNEAPISVTLQGGPFIERFRDNEKILQYFGNVRKLTELPVGKPSGQWALSIGLALQQLWREQASRATVKEIGEDKHPTVSFKHPFTRFQLLDLYRPETWVEDVLASPNPQRAQTYWKEAIRLLKSRGVISYYKELDPLPMSRQGWRQPWLHTQRLDIRPNSENTLNVAEISGETKKRQRRSK